MHVRLWCGSLSITTPVSLLANEFDVQSILHGQVHLAAVNQICVIHEALNSYKKKSKGSLKACFKLFYTQILLFIQTYVLYGSMCEM